MKLTRLVPMLGVADVARALAFYRDALDFKLNDEFREDGELLWCCIERDQVRLMLTRWGHFQDSDAARRARATTMLYFYPDDVLALHASLKTKGFAPGDTCVTFYGMKEFQMHDPDGYSLFFGQPTDEKPTE